MDMENKLKSSEVELGEKKKNHFKLESVLREMEDSLGIQKKEKDRMEKMIEDYSRQVDTFSSDY